MRGQFLWRASDSLDVTFTGSKPPTLTILIIDSTKSGQQWPRAAVVAITMIVTLFAAAAAALRAAYGRRG